MTVMWPGHPAYKQCMEDAKRGVPMNRAARKNFTPLDVEHAQQAIDVALNYDLNPKIDDEFIGRMRQYIADNGGAAPTPDPDAFVNTPPPATPAATRDELKAMLNDLLEG